MTRRKPWWKICFAMAAIAAGGFVGLLAWRLQYPHSDIQRAWVDIFLGVLVLLAAWSVVVGLLVRPRGSGESAESEPGKSAEPEPGETSTQRAWLGPVAGLTTMVAIVAGTYLFLTQSSGCTTCFGYRATTASPAELAFDDDDVAVAADLPTEDESVVTPTTGPPTTLPPLATDADGDIGIVAWLAANQGRYRSDDDRSWVTVSADGERAVLEYQIRADGSAEEGTFVIGEEDGTYWIQSLGTIGNFVLGELGAGGQFVPLWPDPYDKAVTVAIPDSKTLVFTYATSNDPAAHPELQWSVRVQRDDNE